MGAGLAKNANRSGKKIKSNNRSNRKRGNLTKVPAQRHNYKPPKWPDITYKTKEKTEHIKGEQRGKKVTTKTTYHGIKNPNNLSNRKLKKSFGDEKPANPTHITQEQKTIFTDSNRFFDKVQDSKKSTTRNTTGYTLADQHRDTSVKDKDKSRSKSKFLRADKQGQSKLKKMYEDSGIKGLAKVKLRGKVQRESASLTPCKKHQVTGSCSRHGKGIPGTMGNKPLKTTRVRTFNKGTSADDAMAGRFNPSKSPRAMNEMLGHSVKKIKNKTYGDRVGTETISNLRGSAGSGDFNKKAPQHASSRGKVNKTKIKFHDRSTIKLKQNIYNDNIAQKRSPVYGQIHQSDFRQLRKEDKRQDNDAVMKNWKKTGVVKIKNIARATN